MGNRGTTCRMAVVISAIAACSAPTSTTTPTQTSVSPRPPTPPPRIATQPIPSSSAGPAPSTAQVTSPPAQPRTPTLCTEAAVLALAAPAKLVASERLADVVHPGDNLAFMMGIACNERESEQACKKRTQKAVSTTFGKEFSVQSALFGSAADHFLAELDMGGAKLRLSEKDDAAFVRLRARLGPRVSIKPMSSRAGASAKRMWTMVTGPTGKQARELRVRLVIASGSSVHETLSAVAASVQRARFKVIKWTPNVDRTISLLIGCLLPGV